MHAMSPSPLLQCLSQLNDDVWAHVLLPKLVQQGSASAVALSCTQLRRLCQHSVDTLKLDTLPDSSLSPEQLAQHAAAIETHFPNCRTLQLHANRETSFWQLQAVMPLLGRLPQLDTASLSLYGDNRPLPTAMLLGSLQTALTGLRSLQVSLWPQHSWGAAPFCWVTLAQFTQLTGLEVFFDEEPDAFDCRHLSVLGRLSNLQRLLVSPCAYGTVMAAPVDAAAGADAHPYGWLGALSALTRLQLSLPTVSGLASVSACTNLRMLWLQAATEQEGELRLGQAEWQAVGQLSSLTCLALHGFGEATSGPCHDALSRLSALQSVAGPKWTSDTLQVLSHLPHLDELNGGWSASTVLAPGVSCEHVTLLEGFYGDVPFQAFPNLRKVVMAAIAGKYVSLASFASLPQHCPKLQELWVMHRPFQKPALPVCLAPITPLPERMPAILGLSRLADLSVLGWKPSDNAELAALVAAAEPLLARKLRHVAVVLEPGSEVSPLGLMHLARLLALEQLDIAICDEDWECADGAVSALLTALCRIRRVGVLVPDPESLDAWQEMRDWCVDHGLPLPAELDLGSEAPAPLLWEES